jgi:hypothetical protein
MFLQNLLKPLGLILYYICCCGIAYALVHNSFIDSWHIIIIYISVTETIVLRLLESPQAVSGQRILKHEL